MPRTTSSGTLDAAGTRRSAASAPWLRLRAVLAGPDGRAVAVLVALPLLFFAVPAAFGHPAITGDNLIQNFPLRVLTGTQLRQGHLPLWNPYIWSGSPLLGGLNSGSFYPFTFVFAVLAPVAAWVVNLLGVYWAGGLGLYALARQYQIRPLPAVLGALTYAFSGAMSGQIVHLGVVEGMGWMPLVVLALLRLSWAVLGTGPVGGGEPALADPGRTEHGRRRSSSWGWVALLALLVGLEALTGEPRAIAETEVVGAAVGLWLLLRPYRGRVAVADRVRFFGCAVVAAVWGIALAAAELVPGWTFIQASQRAVETYQFFGSGSLRVRWSLLLLVPDLFGGAGLFGQVRYFNHYNLAEVTGYVGLLPLAGALVLVTRSFGRRRSPRSSDWGMWLALALFGLLLAWGTYTPLGHVWAAIPLFGKTRLQSRSLGIVDLALAVLLAFWADRILAPHGSVGAAEDRAGPTGPADPTGPAGSKREWRTYLAAAPAAAAIVVSTVTLAAPVPMEEWLQASPAGAALARNLWPWFLAQMIVAGGIVALVAWWRRLAPHVRRRALVGIVVADLALFVMATSTAVAPPSATFEPSHGPAAAVLGAHGRFAIVDTAVSHLDTAVHIGQPDLNVFTALHSVQGYGSILSQGYGAATGAHTLDTLSACALAKGTFGPLRLSTLLAFAGNLVRPAGPVPRPPAAPRPCPGSPPTGSPPTGSPPLRPASAAHRRVLYLGWPVELRAATLLSTVAPVPATLPKVGVVAPRGGTRWPAETVERSATGWTVRFSTPQRAAGIVVAGPAGDISEGSTVTRAGGGRWAFDGRFQGALDSASWRFTGTWARAFGIFRRAGPVRPPVWLEGSPAGSSVRQVAVTDWGGATDRVVATRAVTVVWSEAYLRGWHAVLTPRGPGGARSRSSPGAGTLSETVHADGLVQAVRVPKGSWTLTFSYEPRHFMLGVAGTLVAVAGFVALALATLVSRRRHRRLAADDPVA